MKMSRVCLALGVVLLMAVSSDADIQSLAHPVQCCFTFIDFKIPANRIAKVEKLSSTCPKEGFVVSTVAEKKFCVKEFPTLPSDA